MELWYGTIREKAVLGWEQGSRLKKRVRRGKNIIFKFHVVNMDYLTKKFSSELVVQ